MTPLVLLIIAHKQPLYCQGFYELMRKAKGISNILKVSDTGTLLDRLDENTGGVLFICDTFYGATTMRFLKTLNTDYPGFKIVVLTTSKDAGYIKSLGATGAVGVINAGTNGEAIKNSIPIVTVGNSFFCPVITNIIAGNKTQKIYYETTDTSVFGLCPKEMEVLRLRAKRKSIRDIMEALGISKPTAKQYSSKVLKQIKKAGYEDVLDFVLKTGYNR